MMKKLNSTYIVLSAKWKELLKILPLFFLYSIHCSDYRKCYESKKLCLTNSVENLVFPENEFEVKIFSNGEVHSEVTILNTNNRYRNRFFLRFNFFSKKNELLDTFQTEEWTLVESGEDTFKCRFEIDAKNAKKVKRHTIEIHGEEYTTQKQGQYFYQIAFIFFIAFCLVLLAYAAKNYKKN